MSDTEINILYYVLPVAGLIITLLAQMYIKISYNRYKQIDTSNHKRGADVARTILDKYNLQNVTVEEVSGDLTDHYDPTKKVVRLSSDIYNGTSIASVSVAAHECGHAIQDKIGYTPMRIRSKIVPLVNFSTKIGYFIVVIGLTFWLLKLAIIGICLLLGMLLFQLITLPVEFDASRRGKKELASLNILDSREQRGSKIMLRAAALTYVASVIATLFEILRLALVVLSRRSRR